MELAEHIGIKPPTLRKWLDELVRRGLPLDREEDHPNVFWSVPQGWFPGGVVLDAEDATALMRQLLRQPHNKLRERLLRRILEASPRASAERGQAHAVVAPVITEVEEGVLPVVEDSLMTRRALVFRYYSAGSGAYDARSASVQRLVPGPPARILAVCHRSDSLKWFRLERMSSPRMEGAEAYREAAREAVEAVLRESVGGFHGGGEAVTCVFTVTDPEARWVGDNLPSPMTVEPVAGGVRVSTRTAAVLPVARFVVGLGGAALAETPELGRWWRNSRRGRCFGRVARRTDAGGAVVQDRPH